MPRVIHDPVHGHVRLTDEEMAVVSHPLFLRLHYIRQTSALYYVWPGATHTRFAHSIGVMHMADTLLGAVIRQSIAASEKLYGLKKALPGQAVRLLEYQEKNKKGWKALRRLVRLAALVHDLGHGPLSHCFNISPDRIRVQALIAKPPCRSVEMPITNALRGRTHAQVEHEVMSCVFFALICAELGIDSWVPHAVAAVLLNRPVEEIHDRIDREVPGLVPFIPFVRDLVSSAPVDADRMDYLERDSLASGVKYGLYDRERLLKSALCVRDLGPETAFRLGWKLSGIRAVEYVVYARFQMFVQHYYHKTNHAVILMLRELSRLIQEKKVEIVNSEGIDALVLSYTRLTDESFLRGLAGEGNAAWSSGAIQELAQKILRRQLWKRIYEFDREKAPQAEVFAEEMRKRHPAARVLLDRIPLKATKDLDRGAYLLELDASRRYQCTPNGRTWLEASAMLRTLRDDEQSLIRLFVAMDDASSPQLVQTLKRDALRLAAEFPFSSG